MGTSPFARVRTRHLQAMAVDVAADPGSVLRGAQLPLRGDCSRLAAVDCGFRHLCGYRRNRASCRQLADRRLHHHEPLHEPRPGREGGTGRYALRSRPIHRRCDLAPFGQRLYLSDPPLGGDRRRPGDHHMHDRPPLHSPRALRDQQQEQERARHRARPPGGSRTGCRHAHPRDPAHAVARHKRGRLGGRQSPTQEYDDPGFPSTGLSHGRPRVGAQARGHADHCGYPLRLSGTNRPHLPDLQAGGRTHQDPAQPGRSGLGHRQPLRRPRPRYQGPFGPAQDTRPMWAPFRTSSRVARSS